VDAFSPRLLQIDAGSPVALSPVAFSGRVDELTLERWIVENPDLVGEKLLVLGHQLAEFEEDRDRLDILALDRFGEIVLIELKVTEDFRVTDLQALAYAGAYAKRTSKDLAGTLERHMRKQATAPAATADAPALVDAVESALGFAHARLTGNDSAAPSASPTAIPAAVVTAEDARAAIASFIEIDDFSEWQPSQHVRIKLVAPNFPRRVLQTVKWLGDVYSVRLEAITVRLFETAPKKYSIAFERLLPLPTEDQFDMTVREREERQRQENTTRRAAVLPLLVNNGSLKHGQTLYAVQAMLLREHRDLYDAGRVVFQVRVHAPDGAAPKLAWRANAEDAEEILSPSLVAQRIYHAVLPDWDKEFTTAVASNFAVSPGGKTLEDVALETGVWE
jgi:hypothetical protein